MKRKLISLTLALLLLCGLAGCGQATTDSTTPPSESQTQTETLPADTDVETEGSSAPSETQTPQTDGSPDKGSLENTPLGQAVDSQPPAAPTPAKPVTQNKPSAVGGVVDAPIEKEPENSEQIEPPKTPAVTKHTPILESAYYGYSKLSAQERKLYSAIRDSVMRTKNVADVRALGISSDSLMKVYSHFLADYPQCFWVTKMIGATINREDRTLSFVLLYYTDGKTTDKLNDLGVPTAGHTASRSVISGQIETFEQAVKQVVDSIPPASTDEEKARIIHDFVLKWVGYDYDAVSLTPETGFDSPAFTVYGAMILRSCVCEGYAKLFQYLCYQVGLPCLQVQGTSLDGGGHMWNMVQLNGKWRHVDVTWDDGQKGGEICYDYFALTDAQIKADHIIVQGQSYKVPAAV